MRLRQGHCWWWALLGLASPVEAQLLVSQEALVPQGAPVSHKALKPLALSSEPRDAEARAEWSYAQSRRDPLLAAESGKDRLVQGPCDVGSHQRTGYVDTGNGAHYFYWLVESRTATPHQDPLLLWLTGGPGCSSMLAMFTENGPCRVHRPDGLDGWETSRNPWSWTEAANVLWVDQPGGVGFSTLPWNGSVDTESGVAMHMEHFLEGFYARYPRFLQVPLFLFGESYAGHYVPAIATRLLEARSPRFPVPLAGIAIGNALVDPTLQFASKPTMAFTGGQGGSVSGVVNRTVFQSMQKALPSCLAKIRKCQRTHLEVACLDAYDTCSRTQVDPIFFTGRSPYDLRIRCKSPPLCYDFSVVVDFLNDRQVQKSLGVRNESRWDLCNYAVNAGFVLSGDWFAGFSHRFLDLLLQGMPVLVYSGDTDTTVDWIGTKAWVDSIPWPNPDVKGNKAKEADYVLDGRTRGREHTRAGLTFLQIFDSGHLVPMDQPEVALSMVRKFINPASPWRPEPVEMRLHGAGARRSGVSASVAANGSTEGVASADAEGGSASTLRAPLAEVGSVWLAAAAIAAVLVLAALPRLQRRLLRLAPSPCEGYPPLLAGAS